MDYKQGSYCLEYKPMDVLNQILFEKYYRYVNISVSKCFPQVKYVEI